MNLATASKPEKLTYIEAQKKIIKPARFVDGVPLDPVYKTIDVPVTKWIVTTQYEGAVEEHKFNTEEEATSFYNSFK